MLFRSRFARRHLRRIDHGAQCRQVRANWLSANASFVGAGAPIAIGTTFIFVGDPYSDLPYGRPAQCPLPDGDRIDAITAAKRRSSPASTICNSRFKRFAYSLHKELARNWCCEISSTERKGRILVVSLFRRSTISWTSPRTKTRPDTDRASMTSAGISIS